MHSQFPWVLVAFLFACATPVTPPVVEPVGEERAPNFQQQAVGRELYADNCMTCHGADGRGQGPLASALRSAPADLTRIRERRGGDFPRQELSYLIDGRFEVLGHGPREMPVWGRRLRAGLVANEDSEALVRGRIDALVEYLDSLQVGSSQP